MNHKFTIQSPSRSGRLYDDPSQIHNRKLRKKYIDEDTNLLVVISAYLNGSGATEVRRLAAALNLKNYQSCRNMFNKASKYYVGNIIIQEARDVVKECLFEEIKKSFFEKNLESTEEDWNLYRAQMFNHNRAHTDSIVTNHHERTFSPVDLVVSADMGWQKRSSGRKYDSPSGHMFLIGSSTNKIIEYDLKCVSCTICLSAKKNNKVPKPHNCFKNFDGHAKAMEAVSAAELVSRISKDCNGLARVATMISDDDSSMRSHCSHNGGLPTNVHEPIFLADPSHRCKVIGKPLFKLASQKKSVCTLTTHDATRIKVYTACFFNQNRDKNRSLEWMKKHVWCVLYHYFDDHRFCTSDFCYKKREQHNHSDHSQNGDESNNASKSTKQSESSNHLSKLHALRSKPGYYRSMEKDKKLFLQLKECLSTYFSEEQIKELMHGHNTQTNEGLNTAMCVTAPKYKNFSKSIELSVRDALVAGCHNLGRYKFIERVVEKLNFQEKPTAFLNLLEYEDRCKRKRQQRQATVVVKKRRITSRVSKALEGRLKDIKATEKGTTYGDIKPRKKKLENPSTCPFRCYGCNTPGHTHTTIQANECKYHYLWKQNRELDNPEKISRNEWLNRVKAVWEEENIHEISQSQISINDVIENEYQGNTSLTSPRNYVNSNSSTELYLANAADTGNHTTQLISQDLDAQTDYHLCSIDMCDIQFADSDSDDDFSESDGSQCSDDLEDSWNKFWSSQCDNVDDKLPSV